MLKKQLFISVYLINHIFQTLFHMWHWNLLKLIDCANIGRKNVRRNQGPISLNSCTDLNKTQFSLWVSSLRNDFIKSCNDFNVMTLLSNDLSNDFVRLYMNFVFEKLWTNRFFKHEQSHKRHEGIRLTNFQGKWE